MITEHDVIHKYLGVPFAHQGRTMDGLDCYGLILMVYADMGIILFDPDGYEANWVNHGGNYFIEHYHLQWEPVLIPKAMDVVLFKNDKDRVNHAGIVLSNNRFIHSSINVGTVINRLHDRHWMSKIYGYYRYKHDNH